MDSQRDNASPETYTRHADGSYVRSADGDYVRLADGTYATKADAVVTGYETQTVTATREVTDYRTELARFRKPLIGLPWIAGLIGVPLVLSLIGGALGGGQPVAPATPTSSAAPATSTESSTSTTTTTSTSTSTSTSTTTPPAMAPATFSVTEAGKAVTLAAVVPTEDAKVALVKAVTDAYGAGYTVTDKVTVDAAAPAVDLTSFGSNVAAGLKTISGVTLSAASGQVTLAGTVADEAAKSNALQMIGAAWPGATIDSAGLKIAAAAPSCDPVAAKANVSAITGTTKIKFATGGAALTPESQAALKKIADGVKACGEIKLSVVGNTDNVGSAAFNQTLSEKRAAQVKALLVQLGVPAANITTSGKGMSNPIASNSTEAGRSDNRRVDISVL